MHILVNMGLKDRLRNTIQNITIDDDDINGLIQSGSKEIVLKNDITLSETINVDRDNITIDGNGHTIDAKRNQAINITADNITLKNITVKNAHPNRAGGAIFNLSGKVKIINCTFNDNHTDTNNGGALYNEDGEIIIDECDFTNNTARFGGAIYNKGILRIIFSNFSRNRSSKGLSIFNSSELTLDTCNFNRKSDSHNYEIYNMGIINIKSFQDELIEEMTEGGFIHIDAKHAKSFRYLDKLIHSKKKEIRLNFDIDFEEGDEEIIIDVDNIKINGMGRRIDAMGKSNIFKILGDGITISNLNFRNGSSECGGAILNKGNSLKLHNCNFNCNISNSGGAVRNEGEMEMEKCSFEKNIANSANAGAVENIGKLTLTRCDFEGNYAITDGGAIDNSGIINLKKCVFNSNIAKNGASIKNNRNAMLSGCEFEDNKAFDQGSVIYNEGSAGMERCRTCNNISNKYSNIIYQKGDGNSILDIKNCTFTRDSFNNNLIFLEDGSSEIKSSKFTLKREHDNSYIVYNENAIVNIENIEFENVNAKAIYNNNVVEIERDMEEYVELGCNAEPLNYKSD